MKQVIRLTESDLHNIVRKAVNEAMNEVSFRGQSFHGNNAEDWDTMASYRNRLNNPTWTDDVKNFGRAMKDCQNADDISSKPTLNRRYLDGEYGKKIDNRVNDMANHIDHISRYNRFLNKH